MTEPERNEDQEVCECSDDPKLTDEEWAYIESMSTRDDP